MSAPSGRIARVRTLTSQDREIWRLAVPAFFALVSEPLMLLADSAIVGHLGTPQLAALGVAGVVLQTVVGICVFLAYGTTSAVARRIGAGDHRGALAQGVDGMWLAMVLGAALALAGALLAEPLVEGFDPSPQVASYAVTYLRISCLGIPSMLLMLAATGVLRGLQDTRTPLIVAVSANLANIGFNIALVYGAGLDIAGSALGTVLAQTGAAIALVWVVVRGARRDGASARPLACRLSVTLLPAIRFAPSPGRTSAHPALAAAMSPPSACRWRRGAGQCPAWSRWPARPQR
jgi:putative MATE family efflux protein